MSGFAQEPIAEEDSLWQPVGESAVALRGERRLRPERYRTAVLNVNELRQKFISIPLENTPGARAQRTTLSIPDPSGKLIRFYIEKTNLLSPEVAAKFPSWRTFQGYGIDDPTATAKFDWTDAGFHGYVLSSSGSFSIDPMQTNDVESYIIFNKSEYGERARLSCELENAEPDLLDLFSSAGNNGSFISSFSHGGQLRNYRLAVATTYEYTNRFRQTGDSDEQAQARAFAQVVTTVNRVDGVYRKELAVTFTLVSGTNLTYVVNPEVPSDYTSGSSANLTANQTNINSVIGIENYDVGHLFTVSNGGVASLSSVCGSSKARGLSGQPNPVGDPFDVDYVAHELGHQFAANHTFNATNNCGSSPAAARKEPGSAVTIMGYAGICSGGANIQRNSIDIFHVHNLTESINFITNGNGATCGTLEGTNSPPVIDALENYAIPFNTPFALTASASDADGDPLTYNWEQNNGGLTTSNYPNTTDDDDISLVFRPGFRSYLPSPEPTRSFPSLPYILSNSNEAPITFSGISILGSICGGNCITGEDLPSAARTMNFRVSVRDGRGGISDQGTVITVVNTTTPFRVTTQNSNVEEWTGGQQKTVTWDVSGTTESGINTANVKISISADGGQTFSYVVAESTPNDGSQSITVPAISTEQARIKIEAVGNIFFDINDADFSIASGPTGPTAVLDFDGDGKTDVTIFRPLGGTGGGEWWTLGSSDGVARGFAFGAPTDIPVPADYTGDGKTDIAIWRETSGEWFILRSEDFTYYAFPYGTAGDIPMPGDYDGDGEADANVFRPSTSTWYTRSSSDGVTIVTAFGTTGDVPITGDFDGDGKADIAVYRINTGGATHWFVRLSANGQIRGYEFGLWTDIHVSADYTGDGKTDIAFWRPSNGFWYILRSEDWSYYWLPFGVSTDIPVSGGDYDGDGKADLVVFRPSTSTWYIQKSTDGFQAVAFGQQGDKPLPALFGN